MSKRINRKPRRPRGPVRAGDAPPGEPSSAREALARLLDTPDLARVVPHLAPEMLHHLIKHRGLDVCAEIVAAATPTQLASVLDLDLWQSARPGHDEHFDTERFGEWLELLVDLGGTLAARTVAAMDTHLVVAGLSQYVRVFDHAAIAPAVDREPLDIDVTPHQEPECDVGGYLVRGRSQNAWDAIVSLLIALDADHNDRFHAVMRACRRLSNSTPEVDGLDDLLVEPDQLLHDVAHDREHRRTQQGYSTPADSRAFLLMARQRRRPSKGQPPVNPFVTAYFRKAGDTTGSKNDDTPSDQQHTLEPPAALEDVAEAHDAIVAMLVNAGLVLQQPRALLEGTDAQPSRLALIRTLIEHVRDNDETLYLARSHELVFLANTLVAGCSIQSRSFTPQEASDATVAVCNLGLEHWPARWPEFAAPPTAGLDMKPPHTFLMDHDLVSAFEVGWAVLHEDVSMFAAGQLICALSKMRCRDTEIQKGLNALRRELTKQCKAGTPGRARNALDVIAMLDLPAWISVVGLLDECPILPAALTATLDGRTGAVSATAFEFISTCSQLGSVRDFMARFPEIVDPGSM